MVGIALLHHLVVEGLLHATHSEQYLLFVQVAIFVLVDHVKSFLECLLRLHEMMTQSRRNKLYNKPKITRIVNKPRRILIQLLKQTPQLLNRYRQHILHITLLKLPPANPAIAIHIHHLEMTPHFLQILGCGQVVTDVCHDILFEFVQVAELFYGG